MHVFLQHLNINKDCYATFELYGHEHQTWILLTKSTLFNEEEEGQFSQSVDKAYILLFYCNTLYLAIV